MTNDTISALAHAQDEVIRQQKIKSTLASVVISILCLALIGLILAIISLTMDVKVQEKIITYSSVQVEETVIEERVVQTKPESKPASPSSSSSRVISSNAISPVAVTVPDVDVKDFNLGSGNGDGFGDGFGEGWGNGTGGKGANFFNTNSSAERVLFIIDYSQSMAGPRQKLMRAELAKSVQNLVVGTQFQMIFFAGPAWVAGDSIQMDGKVGAKIDHNGKIFNWTSPGSAHDWNAPKELPKPTWISASEESIQARLPIIKDTRLIWGTDWASPFELAFQMDPLPQAIFFMTDGASGKDSMDIAKKWSRLAKRHKIPINAIALMQPQAEEALSRLAKSTGGQFSVVGADGKAVVKDN